MISGSFCELKTMENQHKFVLANVIAIVRKFSWNFIDFHFISGSKIHPKITQISILGASGDNLASIWCRKVESGWILSVLGPIFHGFGVDFGSIFEWITRGFCKQSLDEQYALIAALNIRSLLTHGIAHKAIWCGGVRIAPGIALKITSKKC